MSGEPLPDIRSLSLAEIEAFFKRSGEKSFRARQVDEWLWRKACRSFGDITSLSSAARKCLKENFTFRVLRIEKIQKSKDGTVKAGFLTGNGNPAEGVLIPSGNRVTACISSQSGCPLGCSFCATAQLGFLENLTAGEIFDQVAILSEILQQSANSQQQTAGTRHPLSNIVFMGMCEPLLNYENVTRAIEKITAPGGLNFSPQRITVSSVGIPKMIRKMADDGARFHFALSLHAANNAKRDRIVPVNRRYPVEELTEAMQYYHRITGRRFTIEYILLKDFNDSVQDARELAHFCKNFPVKINLIGYNPVRENELSKAGTGKPVHETGFDAPDKEKINAFKAFLESLNLVVNLRKSRGRDIDAACGQLAGKL